MAPIAAGIVLAAGSGQRLGAGRAKGFVELAGRPLLEWPLRTLATLDELTRLVLVVPDPFDAGSLSNLRRELGSRLEIVSGGARRRDSVLAGLNATGDAEYVLVHDAARALIDAPLARRVLDGAKLHGAAIPVVAVSDALLRHRPEVPDEEVPRAELRAVQTPQGFRTSLLRRAHESAPREWDALDDGAMVRRLGEPVAHVEGDPGNFKITWPGDMARAEAWLQATRGIAVDDRIGLGWDVHPLVPGRTFFLAGVCVTTEFGPKGHSDGDPLAHAIADALLGAAALGDVGTLFPDTDPKCAGISGIAVLRGVVEKLARDGFVPSQVDAVLITDVPKIAPHRDAIRVALAQVLNLPLERVSLKGKRTEGLGALAAGQGVECHAIARVTRKAHS